MNALFVPLKTEYFEAFADGSKTDELRRYGARWNERTCVVGRPVVLSKGYGKAHRLSGRIWKFKKQHGSTFGSTYRAAIQKVFGTIDIDIACIGIEISRVSEPPREQNKEKDDDQSRSGQPQPAVEGLTNAATTEKVSGCLYCESAWPLDGMVHLTPNGRFPCVKGLPVPQIPDGAGTEPRPNCGTCGKPTTTSQLLQYGCCSNCWPDWEAGTPI